MKAFRQLGFLKLPLQRAHPAPEDHRVLMLFRNRAELKKAFGDLKEEVERLKDRIKQQEGVTRRVRDTLTALEYRLGVNETAYPALVFYQLRGLWRTGHDLLEHFASEIAGQQEDRERRQHLAEHNRRQFARRHSAEQHLKTMRARAARARQRLEELEQRRSQLRRFWQFFKRRALEQDLARVREQVAAADRAFAVANRTVADVAAEPVPQFPGLSVRARRLINLSIVAYAETMCARLATLPLLVMRAREATLSRDVIDEYGTPEECLKMMNQIERALAVVNSRARVGEDVRERLHRLRKRASYRDDEDTVATAESLVVALGDSAEPGGAPESIPNVLAEDTWNIHSILLR